MSLEKEIGERLQQSVWRWCPPDRSAAATEIEDQLIQRVTSHLTPPLPSESSIIGQIRWSRSENSSKFNQGCDADPSRPARDPRAYRRIAHPGWDLSGKTRRHLDIKNLSTSTMLSAIDTNPLTVQRMPRVRYDDKFRSVC